MFLKKNDDIIIYPYSLHQLHSEYPNVSFPSDIDDATLAEYGVYRVLKTAQPDHNPLIHSCRELTPSYQEGLWIQQWEIVELFSEEEAAKRVKESYVTVYSVTMRQLRIYLYQKGLLQRVTEIIEGLSGEAKIEWEYASVVDRRSQFLAMVAGALELTESEVNQMFEEASVL
jgi:hypothetical protein